MNKKLDSFRELVALVAETKTYLADAIRPAKGASSELRELYMDYICSGWNKVNKLVSKRMFFRLVRELISDIDNFVEVPIQLKTIRGVVHLVNAELDFENAEFELKHPDLDVENADFDLPRLGLPRVRWVLIGSDKAEDATDSELIEQYPEKEVEPDLEDQIEPDLEDQIEPDLEEYQEYQEYPEDYPEELLPEDPSDYDIS